MKPAFAANGVTIYQGDSRELLRQLPDESVHCCVTSPPYWGLRDYGTAQWAGGSVECDHVSGRANRTITDASAKQSTNGGSWASETRSVCPKCGATRQDHQIGLESTPYEYISTMRMLFAEVRRVLRSDGTLWLNMGDSYTSGGRKERDPGQSKIHPAFEGDNFADGLRPNTPQGMKPKDLCGIPWMLAFALREDGWYLRQDIIWAKPNPMPESVTDRCTKSHEYIFLLSKSERYYFNQEAILEPVSANTHARLSQDVQNQIGSDRVPGKTNGNMKAVARRTDGGNGSWRGDRTIPAEDRKALPETQARLGAYRDQQRKLAAAGSGIKNNSSFDAAMAIMPESRNRRSVWSVTTQPFPEAHFATFPEDLIKPCILAGCPEGGTVLDPFGGAGTTGLVARKLHCKAILLELNQEYIDISAKRLSQEVLQFTGAQ
jgi:DNA modification methylase